MSDASIHHFPFACYFFRIASPWHMEMEEGPTNRESGQLHTRAQGTEASHAEGRAF